MADAVNRDRTLVKGLEQCRLRARGRAVQLVDEQHVGEHRTRHEHEAVLVWVPHRRTSDIAGQQVSSALDPTKAATARARERPRQRGLATARDVLHEDVSTREEAGRDQLDSRTAAVYDPLD